MLITGRARTERAARYAKQLADHFSRKVNVQESGGVYHIDFQGALGSMKPTPDALEFVVDADVPTSLYRGMGVMEDHLVRFGARDHLSVEWDDPALAEAYREHQAAS